MRTGPSGDTVCRIGVVALLCGLLVPRAGLEYEMFTDFKIRGGYYYYPSPVKKEQYHTRFMDTDQHVFSAGLGYVWRWPERWFSFPLEIDLYIQYKYLPQRTIISLATSLEDPPDSTPETYKISGRHLGAGLALTMEF